MDRQVVDNEPRVRRACHPSCSLAVMEVCVPAAPEHVNAAVFQIWSSIFFHFFGHYDHAKWCAHFGMSISVVEYCWVRLDSNSPAQFQRVHLLYCFSFAKLYNSVSVLATMWKVSDDTFSSWLWRTWTALAAALNEIHLDARLHDELDPSGYLAVDTKFCYFSVDRTDWDYQKLFFSGHKQTHGLKYQVGVHGKDGRFHTCSVSYRGADDDLNILRFSRLLERLDPDESFWGDKAYCSAANCWAPFKRDHVLTPLEHIWNDYQKRVRVIVENSIGRLCKFGFLHQRWHHTREQHELVFITCVHITNVDIRLHPLRVGREEGAYADSDEDE